MPGFPLWGTFLVGGVAFDADLGLGSRAFLAKPGEAEAVVAMRPSVFLALATPLDNPRASMEWLSARIAEGHALCPAALRVWLPGPDGTAGVVAHDGRHRMSCLRRDADDAEVPVRIIGTNARSGRFTPSMVNGLRRGMRAQRSSARVEGPLFGDATLDGRIPMGTPPPPVGKDRHGNRRRPVRQCSRPGKEASAITIRGRWWMTVPDRHPPSAIALFEPMHGAVAHLLDRTAYPRWVSCEVRFRVGLYRRATLSHVKASLIIVACLFGMERPRWYRFGMRTSEVLMKRIKS